MTDLVAFGETALRLTPPDRQRFETTDDLQMRADGTESNVAVAASRLGADATWLSKLPDTPLGKRVVAELHEHGLDTDVVWTDDGRQGLTFHETGAAPREDVVVRDQRDAAAATAEPGELNLDLVQNADAVFVGGATPSLSTTARRTTEAVLRACRGTRVFELDFEGSLWTPAQARDQLDGLLGAVDVLIANEEQIETAFDRSGKPREIVHTLAADYGFERVVITRSEHGAVAWHDNVIHEQAAIETELVDASGQRDAFVGGFLARLLDDAPTDEALAYGAATAALARTLPGPLATVSEAEIRRLVEEHRDDGGR